MTRTQHLKTTITLSTIIAVLAAVAAGGGLLINSLYQDNFRVTAGWFGNDLVTLFVAVPLLVAAIILTRRGSSRAHLALLGMLDYTLYNFAFYLFGSALNSFYLLYVALFALSIFALVFGLAALDVKGVVKQFRRRTPVKGIAVWMALVALFLGGFWVAQSLSYVFTGQVPDIVQAVDWPTNVVGALDLTFVVSVNALGAVWLWGRRPWGYVLAVVMNVKGAVYMLALAATTITAYQAGAIDGASEAILWGVIGAGCLIACGFLLGNLQPARAKAPARRAGAKL